jgi:hypothetical protein
VHWNLYGSGVRIDILHVTDCPNLDRARMNVRAALDATGLTATVRAVEIATAEAAVEAGMHGSPTILIDGVDAFAATDDVASMSCRLYAAADGRTGGTPTVEQLTAALAG